MSPESELAAALTTLGRRVPGLEGEVLSVLIAMGEPGPQRLLDGLLDQVADTLRALAESAAEVQGDLAALAPPATVAPALGERFLR